MASWRSTGALLAIATAVRSAGFALTAFCGPGGASPPRAADVQQKGWRLDMMEVGTSGIGRLEILEGYFIGERRFAEERHWTWLCGCMGEESTSLMSRDHCIPVAEWQRQA